MSGQEMVQRTPEQRVLATVRGEEFMRQLEPVLPPNVSPAKFVRAFGTALLQNPDLANQASGDSIVTALLRCAQDGLMPDGVQAAIAPYKKKAQYLPMIGGFRHIAGNSGWSLRTFVVYEHDDFEVEYGTETRIVHRPTRPGQDRGAMIAAYAIGAHKDGRREVEVMYADEILKRRSKAQTRLVWDEWPERMWEKTVGKALFKKLPLEDPELQARVVEADDVAPAIRRKLLYPGADTPRAADDGSHSQEPVDQQAGGDSPDSDVSGSSPAPDPEEEEQPFDPDEPLVDVDPTPGAIAQMKEHADDAGQVVAPRTAGAAYAGKSIAQIEQMESGREWLQWAAHPDRKWNRDTSENAVFGLALTAYLAFYHRDLLPQEET